MKIFSLTNLGYELIAFEIEISLMPGLPQISILGQANYLVKESIPKIQSAIKSQGFKLPKAQHILVDLKPQNLKKNNMGVELAIACAILNETRQIRLNDQGSRPWLVAGHLSLKGEVTPIEKSLEEFSERHLFNIITVAPTKIDREHFEVRNLRELKRPKFVSAQKSILQKRPRPRLPDVCFSKAAARLIEIIASGEHACLLAGSCGSGKSTLASMIAKVLAEPSEIELKEIQKVQKLFCQSFASNPVTSVGQTLGGVRPEVIVHHSISPIAFLGGGSRLYPGELTRAHKGTLIMDEFLEFNSEIQDALREPLENARLRIARNGNYLEFPTDFLLVATSNLCQCGEFSMNSQKSCRCSQAKLKNYLSRLSGPCVDRFQILTFSSLWENQKKEFTLESIDAKIKKSLEFRQSKRRQAQPNSKLSNAELANFVDQKLVSNFYKFEYLSERRQIALMKVARTIADLEFHAAVGIKHLQEAFEFTILPFVWLEQAQKANICL